MERESVLQPVTANKERVEEDEDEWRGTMPRILPGHSLSAIQLGFRA